MSPDLQQKLFDAFPRLYQEHQLPMTQTCMCWGVETGDGWFDILWRLSEKLDKLGVIATQVKEKYGTLRFYYRFDGDLDDSPWDEADRFIDAAEAETAVTCEMCASPAKMNKGPWFYVRCESCDKKDTK